jgi:hypothetical protein
MPAITPPISSSPRQARPRPRPALVADLPGRVSLADVDRDKAQLGGFVQALMNQVDRVHLAGAPEQRAAGGQQADRVRAEHGDGVSRPDTRQLGGVPSRHPRVSNEDEIVLMLVTGAPGSTTQFASANGTRTRRLARRSRQPTGPPSFASPP